MLGYVDPDYFLGGEMRLSPDLARTAIERDVCEPLGLDLYEAASAIFSVAIERMVTAIEGITLQQGIDPARAVMIGGGGGAGLYSNAIARRLGVSRVVIPEVAAALSAAGAILSDLQATYALTGVTSTASFDTAQATEILRELRARCEGFVARAGAGAREVEIRYSVEARYPHQVWEIEVPLRGDTLAGVDDLEHFREDFHGLHNELFAVRDDDATVEIVTWHANVRCVLRDGPPGHAQAGFSEPPKRRAKASLLPGNRLRRRASPGAWRTRVRRPDERAADRRLAGDDRRRRPGGGGTAASERLASAPAGGGGAWLTRRLLRRLSSRS